MSANRLVHFIHGKESGPWGRKISALAALARKRGWEVESLDYSHTMDPARRLEQLTAACGQGSGQLVLAGSSMGGWVAAEAAAQVGAHGVFLLAPALHVPAYPSQDPAVPCAHLDIVHGWNDEVIPCDNSIRFARAHGCNLHLIDGDHRLDGRLPYLCTLFDDFLERCAGSDAIA